MLILTGPVTNKLNRMPIVTFVLMGIFAVLGLASKLSEGTRALDVREACIYYATHGYLDADPRLVGLIAQDDYWRYLQKTTANRSGGLSRSKEQLTLESMWDNARDALDNRVTAKLGMKTAEPTTIGWLTFPLIHHGTMQTLFVLLMFYMTAPYLEDRWGRFFMPLLFYAGSLAALLVYWLWQPPTYAPFHGAEYGTTALLAAYLMRFPKEQLRYVYLVPMIKRETHSSVWLLVLYWAVFQCSTAYFWRSHTQYAYPGLLPILAAFAFGALVSVLIQVLGLEKYLHQSDFEKLSKNEQLDTLIERYRLRGLPEELLTTLEEAYRTYPEREDYLREYWTQAVRMDRGTEAVTAGKKLIGIELDQGSFETAYYHWRELTEGQGGQNIPIKQAEHLAEGLIAIGHHLQARDVMAYSIDHLPSGLRDRDLFGLLETARAADPRLALSTLDRLLLEHRRPPEEEPRLKELRAELFTFHPEILEPQAQRQEIPVAMDFGSALADPFAPTRISALKVYRGLLQTFQDNALDFSLVGQEQLKRLPFDGVKAIWASAIRPIGDAPELILDLHLDDPMEQRPVHRVLRLLGREFDPMRFAPKAQNRAEATREMIGRILDRGCGAAMPSRDALLHQRFPSHATTQDFERKAYGVVSA